jgi:nucleotide-binding universal stress UspA family protein
VALEEINLGKSGSAVADRDITSRASVIRVRNVLFATDFSATSEAAMPYAVAICRHFGSMLHLVHVLSDTSLLMMSGGVDYVSMGTLYEDAQNEAREKLEQLARCLEGVPHKSHVQHGQIWNSLARVIEANQIDLIVVGTHGRSGIGKLLLGSVAEDILRHAPCPVLTVGPRVSGRAKLPPFQKLGRDLAPVELELRQIVLATDFRNDAAQLARQAVWLAEEFHARFTIMHVLEDYSHLGREPGAIHDSVKELERLVPADAPLQYAPDIVVEFGSAPERILKVASEREADMIVLGARSAEVGTTHLPWSAAHHVIAQAQCPVLTIRQ